MTQVINQEESRNATMPLNTSELAEEKRFARAPFGVEPYGNRHRE